MGKPSEKLVPPATIMAGILLLLIVARNYERLPWKPPPCTFRTLTGIPCVSCGGTHAFQALSRGQIVKALHFNPLATTAVFGVAAWLLIILFQKREPHPPLSPTRRRRRNRCWGTVAVLILIANWIYLILYLK